MDDLIFDPTADLGIGIGIGINQEKEEVIVHLRKQQRNGRKSITIVENLDQYNDGQLDLTKIVKYFKKNFHCRGTIEKEEDEDGKVIKQTITMSGDNRREIKEFLVKANICDEKHIKIHGV